jgi:hypothetical protein
MGRVTTASASLVTLLALGVAAASGAPPSSVVLTTPGRISAIAADGALVAVETGPHASSCGRIIVWDAQRGSVRRWAGHTSCPAGSGPPSSAGGPGELALAGDRVAWMQTVEASRPGEEQTTLWAADVGEGAPARIASASAGDRSDASGDYLGFLHGDGDLLAFNSWTYCAEGTDRPGCRGAGAGAGATALWRIAGATKVAVPAVQPFPLASVDAGRLAVGSNPIRVVTVSGPVLRTIPTGAEDRRGLALSGTQLAILASGNVLDVYDTVTESLVKKIPLAGGPAAARLGDLESGVAVYLVGRQVRVVRISDGRDRLLAAVPGEPVDAQIERTGAWFAYNRSKGEERGRVVFVPWSSIQAAFRENRLRPNLT